MTMQNCQIWTSLASIDSELISAQNESSLLLVSRVTSGFFDVGFGEVAGLGKECLDEGGPVLDALEPVLDDDGELVHVAGGGCGVGAQHHGSLPSAGRCPASRTWSVKAAGFGATAAGESRSMDGTDRQSRSSASLTGAGASPGANVASNVKRSIRGRAPSGGTTGIA
jgi:hypothetical protein